MPSRNCRDFCWRHKNRYEPSETSLRQGFQLRCPNPVPWAVPLSWERPERTRQQGKTRLIGCSRSEWDRSRRKASNRLTILVRQTNFGIGDCTQPCPATQSFRFWWVTYGVYRAASRSKQHRNNGLDSHRRYTTVLGRPLDGLRHGCDAWKLSLSPWNDSQEKAHYSEWWSKSSLSKAAAMFCLLCRERWQRKK